MEFHFRSRVSFADYRKMVMRLSRKQLLLSEGLGFVIAFFLLIALFDFLNYEMPGSLIITLLAFEGLHLFRYHVQIPRKIRRVYAATKRDQSSEELLIDPRSLHAFSEVAVNHLDPTFVVKTLYFPDAIYLQTEQNLAVALLKKDLQDGNWQDFVAFIQENWHK